MEVIKFKAWDEEASHMYMSDNPHLLISGNGSCINAQTGIKLKPLFSTCIKDINGVEICEGDIVKHNARISENPLVVVFLNGAFCIGKKGIRGSDFNSYVTIRDAIKDGLLVDVDLELEIIGNIYENPELIK